MITNSGSGDTYSDPADFTTSVNLTDGTSSVTGLVYLIVVPGTGTVVQDTGKVTFDSSGDVVFVAGPHQVLSGQAPDPCSVLV